MNRLGKVIHLSSNKNLILRSKLTLKLRTTVVDNRLSPIGKIHDVFGPVTSPYVSIKPSVKNPKKYVGRVLYLMNK
ncbi:MAG: Gar1/Naf1 family protein [Candidatus Bathyarchaeia archaeon]